MNLSFQRNTLSILLVTSSTIACGDDNDGGVTFGATSSVTTTTSTTDATGTETASASGSDSATDSAGSASGTSRGTDSEGATQGAGTDTTSNGATDTDGTTTGGASASISATGTTDATAGATTDESDTTGMSTTGMSTTGASTTGGTQCPLAEMHVPCDSTDNDPFHAIGLNCTTLGGTWNTTNAVVLTNADFQAAPATAAGKPWRVGTQFGSANPPTYAPQEGSKLLIVSSSMIPGSDGGIITETNSSQNVANGNPWDQNNLPAPMLPTDGDTNPDPMIIDCNLMGDCTNTIQAQWQAGGGNPEDKMWFKFDVTAPSLAAGDIADANGYKFEFAFLSREFPDYVNTEYNDMFIVWQSSIEFTGNVVFINGRPITVTALWDNATGVDYIGECPFLDPVPPIPGCTGNSPALAGTGLQQTGAGTGWYTATGGVLPGETFTLAWAIFDMGDSALDSYAVIDDWRWDCEGCVPNEVDSCGIRPQ